MLHQLEDFSRWLAKNKIHDQLVSMSKIGGQSRKGKRHLQCGHLKCLTPVILSPRWGIALQIFVLPKGDTILLSLPPNTPTINELAAAS